MKERNFRQLVDDMRYVIVSNKLEHLIISRYAESVDYDKVVNYINEGKTIRVRKSKR